MVRARDEAARVEGQHAPRQPFPFFKARHVCEPGQSEMRDEGFGRESLNKKIKATCKTVEQVGTSDAPREVGRDGEGG